MNNDVLKINIDGTLLEYKYSRAVDCESFCRAYEGNTSADFNDILNEIIYQEWFFGWENNEPLTLDKPLTFDELNKILDNNKLFNIYYRTLPNVYEFLICDSNNNKLFTADIVEFDEFMEALEQLAN